MKCLCPIILFWIFAATQLQGQTFESSNFPIIIIDTHGAEIVNEPKIEADMMIINNGPGVRNNLTDPYEFEGKIGIEIRGSSSQMFPKKQYGVETWDEEGDGIDVSLLGLPEEEDWVLFAPYNDKALMRDALAYKLARDLGRYAPRTRYCEVVLNGVYNGVYVLIEKIKRDKNRVDINKLDSDEKSGDDLTGGYIIKIDKTEGDSGPGWTSAFTPPDRSGNQTITFQYEEPKYDEIAEEQKQYIQNYVNQFETTLMGSNFNDPVSGYANYIDVESFIDYFILSELTKNVDAYRISTFMHKQRDSDGGKLVMGPVWDFNLGFGNADYCTSGTTDGFVAFSFNRLCPEDFWLVPFWWSRLFDDENFSQKVADRWVALRSDKFKTEAIHGYIDSVSNVLDQEAQQRNFQKWPVLGTYVWPNYFVGSTFRSEVNWLKDWVEERMEWMDANISLVTATEESYPNLRISAFPNPFSASANVEYHLTHPGKVQIELYDLLGRIIENKEFVHPVPGTFRQEVGGQLRKGTYFYTVKVGHWKAGTGKLVKN